MSNWISPSPEKWSKLKDGSECPMCLDLHLPENKFSFLIKELNSSYVRLPKNQFPYGWTIVALKRHACELFELTADELKNYYSDVALVAKGLDKIFKPAKISYLVHGHICPHLHTHLVFTTNKEDRFIPPPAFNSEENFLKQEEYFELIQKIRESISE